MGTKFAKSCVFNNNKLTLLPLKADGPHQNYTWYKIMTRIFWRDWWSLTLLNSKPIVSLLEGMAVVNLISFEPTIEMKCSLINQYVKKQSGHGTSTFYGSNVKHT
jgi:hypothetical protein